MEGLDASYTLILASSFVNLATSTLPRFVACILHVPSLSRVPAQPTMNLCIFAPYETEGYVLTLVIPRQWISRVF